MCQFKDSCFAKRSSANHDSLGGIPGSRGTDGPLGRRVADRHRTPGRQAAVAGSVRPVAIATATSSTGVDARERGGPARPVGRRWERSASGDPGQLLAESGISSLPPPRGRPISGLCGALPPANGGPPVTSSRA
jgi:hypothetical protein